MHDLVSVSCCSPVLPVRVRDEPGEEARSDRRDEVAANSEGKPVEVLLPYLVQVTLPGRVVLLRVSPALM